MKNDTYWRPLKSKDVRKIMKHGIRFIGGMRVFETKRTDSPHRKI